MTGQGRDEGPDRAEDQRSPSRERAREMSQDGAPQRGHSRDRSLPGRRSLSGSRRSRSPQRIDRRSRSSRGSRSRSRSGGRSAVKYNGRAYYGDERVTHVMEIEDDDASFILGAGGRTKRKLSHVCGAELNIEERNGRTVLEMRGTKDTIERAKLYVGFVMQQRVGPVQLPPDAETRDDLTIIEVPHECVGYVTGRKGAGLRSVEEEWNTLMFFTDLRRARRGSELKVMSAVEQKMPGYFTDNITEGSSNNDGFDTDYVTISEKDYSYALGQRGSTRKKLARASGAILEYVGRIAFVAGTLPERMRAKQYLQWLCMQRTSFVHVDTVGRDDCEVVNLPLDAVAYVTGSKGSNLRRVEEETGTFIFLDGARGGGEERLLIFCYDVDARRRARVRIEERIDEKLSGRARRQSTFCIEGVGMCAMFVNPCTTEAVEADIALPLRDAEIMGATDVTMIEAAMVVAVGITVEGAATEAVTGVDTGAAEVGAGGGIAVAPLVGLEEGTTVLAAAPLSTGAGVEEEEVAREALHAASVLTLGACEAIMMRGEERALSWHFLSRCPGEDKRNAGSDDPFSGPISGGACRRRAVCGVLAL
ncbi:kh domain-containing protein [Cyclospora cayetanensis]|uniref:Kh domain-containing protein n=1 Tax=Cyclospora cayetanensis TaxID=88456 RepID=A0A1D3D6E6_9EIME|nr:kh domain-containing protein [Cyclospora cayetanensis]